MKFLLTDSDMEGENDIERQASDGVYIEEKEVEGYSTVENEEVGDPNEEPCGERAL